MTVFSQVVAAADWPADLVRLRLIILISRGWSERRGERRGRKAEAKQEAVEVWRGGPLAEGRMLENKRERLKTFLRKIDEKAIVRIKHFMKER